MRPQKRHSRPKRVTIALWCVFLIGMWNVGKAITFYAQKQYLLTLEITPDPRVLLTGAFVWSILFLGLSLGLWRRMLRPQRPFTYKVIPVTLAIYLIYELSLLLFFAQHPISGGSWFIRIITSLLIVSFAYWALGNQKKGRKSR